MKFTKEELGFILYNNRSKNLINKFLPTNLNPFTLTNIEYLFKKSKDKFIDSNKMVSISISELNLDSEDVIFTKEELNSLKGDFLEYKGKFNQKESDFLSKRGITKEIIEKWSLLGLSNFSDERTLEIIGAKVHPMISNILVDGIEGGGIIFPLYENDKLVNCAIRKISLENTDMSSLKYSLSCPDIPIWKSEDIELYEELWITEGLFDMFALDNIGLKVVSCSSAMWSGLQLYQLLMLKPSRINIFSDNDEVGLKTSASLCDFFKSYGIYSEIFVSKSAKDASEHFFELGLSLEDVEKIDVEINKIISDDSFDFLKYLKNRKY